MVLLALILNIFALQKPHGRGPSINEADVEDQSSRLTAAGLSSSLLAGAISMHEKPPYATGGLNIDANEFSDYRGSI